MRAPLGPRYTLCTVATLGTVWSLDVSSEATTQILSGIRHQQACDVGQCQVLERLVFVAGQVLGWGVGV